MSEHKRVIGYTRVSTHEQASEGVSLAAQRERIETYCNAQRWHLATVHADEGLSGGTLDRPGLYAALADIESGNSSTLNVIVDPDALNPVSSTKLGPPSEASE